MPVKRFEQELGELTVEQAKVLLDDKVKEFYRTAPKGIEHLMSTSDVVLQGKTLTRIVTYESVQLDDRRLVEVFVWESRARLAGFRTELPDTKPVLDFIESKLRDSDFSLEELYRGLDSLGKAGAGARENLQQRAANRDWQREGP